MVSLQNLPFVTKSPKRTRIDTIITMLFEMVTSHPYGTFTNFFLTRLQCKLITLYRE